MRLIAMMMGMTVVSAFAEIEVRLVGADGKPVPEGTFQLEVNRNTTVDGIETAACKVRNEAAGAQQLRIIGRVALDGKAMVAYDGHDTRVLKDTVSRPFFKDDAFMMGAAWGGGGEATAFALGAESGVQVADFTATKSALEISVPVAMPKKGVECETVFHAFPFAEIYGVRDAFARYYPLYPQRFLRDATGACDSVAGVIQAEKVPWDDVRSFPLHRRFLVGERDLIAQEDFPSAASGGDLHSASCQAVRRSFFAGVSLPVASLETEWAMLASYAHVRMNKAGWKPVAGAVAVEEDSEVARYGLATGTWIALNNLKRETRQLSVDVFSGELASGRAGRRRDGGFLFVPFYGGVATNIIADADARVTCTVGPLLANALESVAGVRGTGTLAVQWGGGVGAPVLRVESLDFKGDIFFNASADDYLLEGAPKHRLKPGVSIRAKYRDAWMDGVVSAIRVARHLGETDILCSADGEAKEQAAQVARFFRMASGKRKLEPKVVADSSLAPRTVKVAGFAVVGGDSREFVNRIKRFLDALHWIRYPQYRPEVAMPSADRSLFRLLRP